jgi:four helix bundle protein
MVSVYAATRGLPPDERFGLKSQMQRASVSVMSNIAEGAGRSTDADYARFIDLASGSANELKSLCIVVEDLAMLDERVIDDLTRRVERVRSMCTKFAQTLRSSPN